MFILVEEALRNAVVEAYTKEGKESFVNRDLLQLRRNGITSLEQWSALSNMKKESFNDVLIHVLNMKWNYYKDSDEYVKEKVGKLATTIMLPEISALTNYDSNVEESLKVKNFVKNLGPLYKSNTWPIILDKNDKADLAFAWEFSKIILPTRIKI